MMPNISRDVMLIAEEATELVIVNLTTAGLVVFRVTLEAFGISFIKALEMCELRP